MAGDEVDGGADGTETGPVERGVPGGGSAGALSTFPDPPTDAGGLTPRQRKVLEVIRDWGLNIKAECGGACSCATCHVYVDKDWLDIVGSPNDEEEDMLDSVGDVKSNSRLSCQILCADELDGLKLTLAPSAAKDA